MKELFKSSKIYLHLVNLITTYPVMLHIIPIIILIILSVSCSTINTQGHIETNYPLIDTRLRIHKYKDNIQWKIYPLDKKLLTHYCKNHHQWEDIRPTYRKVNEEMKWVYRVSKNKKSY